MRHRYDCDHAYTTKPRCCDHPPECHPPQLMAELLGQGYKLDEVENYGPYVIMRRDEHRVLLRGTANGTLEPWEEHDLDRATIEEFVIVSSRKTTDGRWIWTRSKRSSALGLANTIFQSMEADGHLHVTITVLDVAAGIATIYRGPRTLASDLREER